MYKNLWRLKGKYKAIEVRLSHYLDSGSGPINHNQSITLVNSTCIQTWTVQRHASVDSPQQRLWRIRPAAWKLWTKAQRQSLPCPRGQLERRHRRHRQRTFWRFQLYHDGKRVYHCQRCFGQQRLCQISMAMRIWGWVHRISKNWRISIKMTDFFVKA